MPDDGSIESIYRRSAPLIFRRCRGILGNEQDALDATHDVFLKLSRGLQRFRGDAALTTWVYRIATNHCLNLLRSRKARDRVLSELSHRVQGVTDPRRELERRDLLRELLSQLKPKDVQIAYHRYCDEMTQPEIAAVVGVSERTVRNRLKHARTYAAEAMARLEAMDGGNPL